MISMCGRYALSRSKSVLAKAFAVEEPAELFPRYNVAPTQSVPVVRLLPGQPGRQLARLRWGLIPWWADDPKIASRLINARSESAGDKPAFREAFRQRRCLVPADGFYEWQRLGRQKQPFFIGRRAGDPLAFAGLWEHWQRGPAGPIETFTILTTEANDRVRPLHERMPAILSPEDYEHWLDPRASNQQLQQLLRPYQGSDLGVMPVSSWVNDVKHDDPRCIEAVADTAGGPSGRP